jgi:hypothetical protein
LTAIGPFLDSPTRRRVGVTAGIGVLFVGGAWARIPYLNGPWYWNWQWRDLNFFRVWLLLLGPAILILFVNSRATRPLPPRRVWPLLGLLMLAQVGLQFLGAAAEPSSLSFVREVVLSDAATGYFKDALRIRSLSAWLEGFDTASLRFHSSTHPPGPILYYYGWIRVVGAESAATFGGFALGVIASFGIPLLYLVAGLWTSEVQPRLTACVMYAVLPALVLFFPTFDQIYPLVSLALVWCWVTALRRRVEASFGVGGLLFVATFFAYNLLTMGAFMALYGVWNVSREKNKRAAWMRLAKVSLVSLSICLILQGMLSLITGFDPIQSFLRALGNQKVYAELFTRPYGPCLFFDLYDFALGAGFLAAPLAAFELRDSLVIKDRDSDSGALTMIGLASILVVDLTGLLRAETSRVWLFLQPFLIIPAARHLARFPGSVPMMLVVLQWIVLVTLKSRMTFLHP